MAFANNVPYPQNDTNFRAMNDNWPVISFTFDLGTVGEKPVSKYMIVSYDVLYAIRYFGTNFIPLWKHTFGDMITLLNKSAYPLREQNLELCAKFDKELMDKIYKKIPNNEYVTMTALVYRQVRPAPPLRSLGHRRHRARLEPR